MIEVSPVYSPIDEDSLLAIIDWGFDIHAWDSGAVFGWVGARAIVFGGAEEREVVCIVPWMNGSRFSDVVRDAEIAISERGPLLGEIELEDLHIIRPGFSMPPTYVIRAPEAHRGASIL